MNAKKITIGKIFSGLQNQMKLKLNHNKKIISHPTSKGDCSELEWKEMLATYLPNRYRVDKAHVIDFHGNISDQIDLVIFDRHYSPFIFKQEGETYVPAECVYAVIEIKPILDIKNIEYASKKAESVRKLLRTSAAITQADGKEFQPKKPFNILAGILTNSGNLSAGGISKLKHLDNIKRLDLGCSLSGSYFKILDQHPWSKINPPYELDNKNKSKNSLVLFFLNLLSELQSMGTVPAIEISKYLEKIK